MAVLDGEERGRELNNSMYFWVVVTGPYIMMKVLGTTTLINFSASFYILSQLRLVLFGELKIKNLDGLCSFQRFHITVWY